MKTLLNFLLGCSHRRTTFPITPARSKLSMYVVCLDCGREFPYDWARMCIGTSEAKRLKGAERRV
jgi:hypothetical protein